MTLKLPVTKNTEHLREDKNLKHIPLELALRRGVREGIKRLSQCYSVYVWTASIPEYARCILNYLDVWKHIEKLYTKESCT